LAFDLYLDPPSPASTVLIDILKSFGRNAIDEAVKRLTGQSPQKSFIIDFPPGSSGQIRCHLLKDLFDHEDWKVKREIIETLFYYNDSALLIS